MSLRDQLLKAGVVSKGDVKKANRNAKKARKAKQGSRKRKGQVRREEEARLAAEREAKRLAKLQARKAREAEEDAALRPLRIRQIVRSNAVRGRGKVPFYVRGLNGRTVHRLSVSEGIASKLRVGELAVAFAPAVKGQSEEVVVIGQRGVARLREVSPEHILFYEEEGRTRPVQPDEQFLEPDWDVSLVPHRVK